jgi:hypothetical protein
LIALVFLIVSICRVGGRGVGAAMRRLRRVRLITEVFTASRVMPSAVDWPVLWRRTGPSP